MIVQLSDFDLILVVQNLELFAVFQHLRLLLELQGEQRVAHDADADVDSLDVVLDGGDGLLDVDEGRVVRERLAGVVDLPARGVQTRVDI